ncbi:ABC transporter substrate-binding protein [Verminephrobacter eiseniae]|uniref:Extracellular solute-binding protein, family 1 n=1 Tax=Verminephrobacter eiseniae (strain EF01-2) TaxID=391735 RepID=A1WJ25_VEREI|nr:extracellular solute-binding protein [Verminephrobacter eiseniae]ABM57632.1 extracellular solute-binding protein, family 1 [Verminephrobacter eiseniae EF01-2]MCW5283252.1 extracellular solute-binding protein [Verminephrobacter eiseniae]MCW5303568.1 extracellular solute-binding protein [Verminephrobacter eiseniae]MCW8181924.1 extracellular solute-binding protein [Verminephrobacter eiseniae]MCW8188362.1 extracellular solute-binding protein [Verminephrobacter eiseniae]
MTETTATTATTQRQPAGLRRRTLIRRGSAALGAALTLGAPTVWGQGKKTLRFLNSETSIDSIRALKVACADYERQFGTRIVIDSVPIDDAFIKVTTSLRGGQPYDIATLAFVGHVLLLQADDRLMPLTELTSKHQWGHKILFPLKNQVYWYPYDYNLAWIYYRKDLYEQKGLSVPKSYEQMLKNAQTLSADGRHGALFPIGSNGATNWLSSGFMWAEGVKLFDDQWNVLLDSAEMAPRVGRYLDFFAALYKSMPAGASQAGFGEMLSNFSSDKVAHVAYAGRIIEALERNAPALSTRYGITPYMDSKGRAKAVNHGYDGWVVLKTPNSDEAMKFMAWFTEHQYINFLHTAPLHFQPPRLDIYDDLRWRAHPLIAKHQEAVETMRSFITDKSVILTSVDTEGPAPDLRPGKVLEGFVIPEMLQNKVLKNMPSAECVKLAADKMRKLTGAGAGAA